MSSGGVRVAYSDRIYLRKGLCVQAAVGADCAYIHATVLVEGAGPYGVVASVALKIDMNSANQKCKKNTFSGKLSPAFGKTTLTTILMPNSDYYNDRRSNRHEVPLEIRGAIVALSTIAGFTQFRIAEALHLQVRDNAGDNNFDG